MQKLKLSLLVLSLLALNSHSQVTQPTTDMRTMQITPQSRPKCNHQCAAACGAFNLGEQCTIHCGCLGGEAEINLARLLQSFNELKHAKLKELTAQNYLSLMYQQDPFGFYSNSVIDAKQNTKQQQQALSKQMSNAGLTSTCDLGCVSTCAAANWENWAQCYRQCNCISYNLMQAASQQSAIQQQQTPTPTQQETSTTQATITTTVTPTVQIITAQAQPQVQVEQPVTVQAPAIQNIAQPATEQVNPFVDELRSLVSELTQEMATSFQNGAATQQPTMQQQTVQQPAVQRPVQLTSPINQQNQQSSEFFDFNWQAQPAQRQQTQPVYTPQPIQQQPVQQQVIQQQPVYQQPVQQPIQQPIVRQQVVQQQPIQQQPIRQQPFQQQPIQQQPVQQQQGQQYKPDLTFDLQSFGQNTVQQPIAQNAQPIIAPQQQPTQQQPTQQPNQQVQTQPVQQQAPVPVPAPAPVIQEPANKWGYDFSAPSLMSSPLFAQGPTNAWGEPIQPQNQPQQFNQFQNLNQFNTQQAPQQQSVQQSQPVQQPVQYDAWGMPIPQEQLPPIDFSFSLTPQASQQQQAGAQQQQSSPQVQFAQEPVIQGAAYSTPNVQQQQQIDQQQAQLLTWDFSNPVEQQMGTVYGQNPQMQPQNQNNPSMPMIDLSAQYMPTSYPPHQYQQQAALLDPNTQYDAFGVPIPPSQIAPPVQGIEGTVQYQHQSSQPGNFAPKQVQSPYDPYIKSDQWGYNFAAINPQMADYISYIPPVQIEPLPESVIEVTPEAIHLEQEVVVPTFAEMQVRMENQRNENRMTAAALSNLLAQDYLSKYISGKWKSSSMTIVAESISRNASNYTVEIDTIYETLIQNLQMQRDNVNMTEINLCKQEQQEQQEQQQTQHNQQIFDESRPTNTSYIGTMLKMANDSLNGTLNQTFVHKMPSMALFANVSAAVSAVNDTLFGSSNNSTVAPQVSAVNDMLFGSSNNSTTVPQPQSLIQKQPQEQKQNQEQQEQQGNSATCIKPEAVIYTEFFSSLLTNKEFERAINARILAETRQFTVSVQQMPEFEQAQYVNFNRNGTSMSLIVLTQDKLGSTDLIILNSTDYSMLYLYKSSMVADINSALGFNIQIADAIADQQTYNFIMQFVEQQTLFTQNAMMSNAIAYTAIRYVHDQQNSSFTPTTWEGYGKIQESSDLSTYISGLNADGVAEVRYGATYMEYMEMLGAFHVVVTLPNKSQHAVDILVQQIGGRTQGIYDTVVFTYGNVSSSKNLTLESNPKGFVIREQTVTSHTPRMTNLINRYKIVKEAMIVAEEGVAASAVLLTWIANANPYTLSVTKVSDSIRGARLAVSYAGITYHMDAVQIEHDGYDSLYQLHVRENQGLITTYNVVVKPNNQSGYEATLLIGGNIVATYMVGLMRTPGYKNVYDVYDIRETIESESIVTEIRSYKNYLQQDNTITEQLLTIIERTVASRQVPNITHIYVTENKTIIYQANGSNLSNQTYVNVTEVTKNTTVEQKVLQQSPYHIDTLNQIISETLSAKSTSGNATNTTSNSTFQILNATSLNLTNIILGDTISAQTDNSTNQTNSTSIMTDRIIETIVSSTFADGHTETFTNKTEIHLQASEAGNKTIDIISANMYSDVEIDAVADATVDTVANATVDTAINETVDAVTNQTVDAATNVTVDTVTNQTVDAVANATVDAVTNATVDAVIDVPFAVVIDIPISAVIDIMVDATDDVVVQQNKTIENEFVYHNITDEIQLVYEHTSATLVLAQGEFLKESNSEVELMSAVAICCLIAIFSVSLFIIVNSLKKKESVQQIELMLDLNNLSEDLVNKKDEEFYLY